nr:MAG TPA: hypothetical protein [Caudoviricetes sp.]
MDERKERIRNIAYDLSDYIDDKLIQIIHRKYNDFDLEYYLSCVSTALIQIWKDNLERAEECTKQLTSGQN